MKPVLPLLGAALLAACSPFAALDTPRVDSATPLAAEVEVARLRTTVSDVVDAHLTDPDTECATLGKDVSTSIWCHLTRAKARALVKTRLEALGFTVTEQVAPGLQMASTNLVVEKRGETKPEEIVFVSAHYDAFWGGADDNTSGVAAMLEVARVLSTRRFARTVRFIGFDLEEAGLLGSTRYVSQLPSSERWVAGLNYDTIAFRSKEKGSQKAPIGFAVPDTGDFIGVIASEGAKGLAREAWQLNASAQLTKVLIAESPGRSDSDLAGNLLRSDHAPFWLTDRPVLFLTDTANFRNPNYHQATDTIDTIDFEFLAEVTRLSVVCVAYWAEVLP